MRHYKNLSIRGKILALGVFLVVGGLTSKKLHFVRKAPNLAWTFIWTI
jgi:hypothetical protein